MRDLTYYLHIPYLIVKDLRGELSEEERLTLEQWLDEREDNRQLFEKIHHQKDTRQRDRIIKKLHKKAAWQRVDRATGGKRLWITCGIRYAAAVVFVISSIFFVIYLLPEKSSREIPLHSEAGINPGSIKAELILADGQHLPLDGKEGNSILSDQDGVTIRKENEGIRYESKNSDGEIAYHELRVPRGGEFPLVLEDGTEVYFNSETKFRYPVKFEESERRVFLEGEAYFKVKRDERPFSVEMGGNRIEVLGTEFNARFYPDEDKQMTTLVSGKVKFISGKDESLELSPGEQAILTSKGKLIRKSVDVNLYTAWKDGNFVFRKQRLEEVLNTLARWYDVNVFYEDVSRKEVEFTGNIKRFERFEEILYLLRMTGDTDFEVKGKNIFVKCK